jgi:amino acid transporter
LTDEPTPPRSFRRSLGLVELVSLGVGGTIGSGIFVVPGIAAAVAGPAALAGWFVVAISACCVAGSLAIAQARARTGSTFVDLLALAFGQRAAAPLVIAYLVASLFGIATIAAGLGQYTGYFGIVDRVPMELACIAVLLLLNLGGIALSGQTENVLSIVKVVAIVAISLALAPHVRPANLVPIEPVAVSALVQVIVIVYWCFSGFEISAIPGAETRNPGHVPRALGIVMALVCLIYLLLNTALIGAAGSATLAASDAPLAAAIESFFPRSGAGTVVAWLAILTMLSALNAYIVAASRVLHAAATRARCQPLLALSTRGVPAIALAIVCIAPAALLAWTDRFDALATAAVLLTLPAYVAICVAALRSSSSSVSRAIGVAGALSTVAILAGYLAYLVV